MELQDFSDQLVKKDLKASLDLLDNQDRLEARDSRDH